MLQNDSTIHFKENDSGIFTLDTSKYKETNSGLLVPENYVEKEKSILDHFRNKYVSFVAGLSLTFASLGLQANNPSSNDLDGILANTEIVDEMNPPRNSNTVDFNEQIRNQQRSRSNQSNNQDNSSSRNLSCHSLGVPSPIQRTQHYGVPVNSQAGSVVNLKDGMPIIMGPNQYLMLDDILNLNYDAANFTKSVLSSSGFRFNQDSIISDRTNPQYIVLNIQAQDKATGCREGVILPIFSPSYFTQWYSDPTPIAPTPDYDPSTPATTPSDDCLTTRLRNEISEILRLRAEEERLMRSAGRTRDEIVRTVEDYDRLLKEPCDEDVKEVIKKENDISQLALIGGYNASNFAQVTPFLGIEIPIKGNYEGTNLTFSAVYVFPSEFPVTGKIDNQSESPGSPQTYSYLLNSNNRSSTFQGDLMFNFGGERINLGIGTYAALHFNEGNSRIDLQAMTHGGLPHVTHGLEENLPKTHFSYGPNAQLNVRLFDGVYIFAKANYDLSNLNKNNFDEKGIFQMEQTDQYRPMTLQLGGKILLNQR